MTKRDRTKRRCAHVTSITLIYPSWPDKWTRNVFESKFSYLFSCPPPSIFSHLAFMSHALLIEHLDGEICLGNLFEMTFHPTLSEANCRALSNDKYQNGHVVIGVVHLWSTVPLASRRWWSARRKLRVDIQCQLVTVEWRAQRRIKNCILNGHQFIYISIINVRPLFMRWQNSSTDCDCLLACACAVDGKTIVSIVISKWPLIHCRPKYGAFEHFGSGAEKIKIHKSKFITNWWGREAREQAAGCIFVHWL